MNAGKFRKNLEFLHIVLTYLAMTAIFTDQIVDFGYWKEYSELAVGALTYSIILMLVGNSTFRDMSVPDYSKEIK